jgi:murein DD-endopeptidase MepM/ murein hydrolase activator NlpD
MMTRTIAISALMMVPFVASSQTPAGRDGASDRRVEEEVRQLSGGEVEALIASDTQTLRRTWSDDFVVTNPLNKFVTKEQVLGLLTSGFLAFKSYHRRIEYARVYGKTVVVAGSETVVWAGKMPMAGKSSALRFTAIWMKQGGRWQEVARHANIILEQ